ncbi:uncharacterized protein [Rhodnius prolixus]|uniref:uncharacterized protein n=1 Tax=Rhodnius prolixus TaxID=13249 RepID=UPI003D18937B
MNSVSFLKNKYEEGDKVFAKVKGYRYWPAKITSVFTSRSNFVKYNVLFYGSNQTGVVKEDQICNYIENKKEHGKLKKKNRSFEKAILEIDADIEDFTTIRANISQIASVNNNLETEFSLVEGEFILATKQSGEIVKIPLNLNRPHFTDDNRKAKWDEIVLHQAKLLKARIEIGETVLAQQEMDNWTKSKAFEIQRRHHLEQKKQAKLKVLKIERQMLNLDLKIKKSLNLATPHPQKCILLLVQLNSLPVTPLMLKKHPGVVNTIRRVRHYIGNIPSWNLTPQMEFMFNQQAAEVRAKADRVYNKFKTLFKIEIDKCLIKLFNSQLRIFRAKTSRLRYRQFMCLTREPL